MTRYQITYNRNGRGRYHISRINEDTTGPGRWTPICGGTAAQRTDGHPRPPGHISTALDQMEHINSDLVHDGCWRAALKIEHPNGEPEEETA